MKQSISAGGVVMNGRGEVIVVSQGGVSWSLPKGHVEQGEDALTAAKREIAEETGVTDLKLVRKLGEYQRYRIGYDEKTGEHPEDTSDLKTIIVYLFTTSQDGRLTPIDPENPEARWVAVADVVALLTHAKDKEFFSKIERSI